MQLQYSGTISSTKLRFYVDCAPYMLQLLHTSECNLILKYFSEALDNRQLFPTDEECVTQLRKLPFYISLSGQQTDLAEYEVYILPQGIPGAEIDVWRSK